MRKLHAAVDHLFPYSGMMPKVQKIGLLLVIALLQLNSFALGLDDFLPDFMSSNNKKIESANADPQIAFSIPESSKKRNASSNTSLYCSTVGNPNCFKDPTSGKNIQRKVTKAGASTPAIDPLVGNQGANDQYFNRNTNNYDANAIANFNITNSNQTALQVSSPKLTNSSPEDTIKNSLAIPLKPNSNTAVSVGTNQVQFNVSY